MEFKFKHHGKIHAIRIERKDDYFRITIENKTYKVTDFTQHAGIISFKLHEKFINVYFAQDKDKKYIAFNGCYVIFDVERNKNFMSRGAVAQKGNTVSSPMPGLLIKVPVSIGDKVQTGTTLAIVEAMKMQNELRAPCDGVVSKINFKEGDQVDALVSIVELEK